MHTTGLPNGSVRAWGVGMWHLIAIWEMAGTPPQGATTSLLDTGPAGVEEGVNRGQPTLEGSTPNPFSMSTTIRFLLPQRSHVTLKVFDMLGREVATLVDGEMAAGEHSVPFTAEGIPGGVYTVQMSAGNVVKRVSIVLVK